MPPTGVWGGTPKQARYPRSESRAIICAISRSISTDEGDFGVRAIEDSFRFVSYTLNHA